MGIYGNAKKLKLFLTAWFLSGSPFDNELYIVNLMTTEKLSLISQLCTNSSKSSHIQVSQVISVPLVYPEKDLMIKSIVFLYLYIQYTTCLLYTSPSPRDGLLSRMPSSA